MAEAKDHFDEWFKKSKVIGNDQNPLLVYHGTAYEYDTFETNPLNAKSYYGLGLSAIGACFSESEEVASSYPRNLGLSNRHVKKVYLSIQNPKKYRTLKGLTVDLIEFCEREKLSLVEERLLNVSLFKKYLRELGYDGVTYKEGPMYNPSKDKAVVWVAFDPEQIHIIGEELNGRQETKDKQE